MRLTKLILRKILLEQRSKQPTIIIYIYFVLLWFNTLQLTVSNSIYLINSIWVQDPPTLKRLVKDNDFSLILPYTTINLFTLCKCLLDYHNKTDSNCIIKQKQTF